MAPRKVIPAVVTASQSDEERTLTDTSCGSTLAYERASGSKVASRSESSHSTGSNKATASGSRSLGATHSEVPAHHATSDEAHSLESARAP